MSKSKYQRGLCIWHGCKNAGTNTNNMQRFCQEHWNMLEQDRRDHEKAMQEIREWATRRRQSASQP